MKAILLAGGKGTRLRPLTVHTPKPIVPIFNRPFLYYQIDLLRQVPEIDEVILSLNYQPRRIEEIFGDGDGLGLKLRYVVEPMPLGTGGAIRYAGDSADRIGRRVQRRRADPGRSRRGARAAPRAQGEGDDRADPGREPARLRPGRDRRATGNIQRFLEKPGEDEITCNTINAGIYVLEPDTFDRIPKDTAWSIERSFFPSLIERGETFVAYVYNGYWIDIGTPAQVPAGAPRHHGRPLPGAAVRRHAQDTAWISPGRPRRRGRRAARALLRRRRRRHQGRRRSPALLGHRPPDARRRRRRVIDGAIIWPNGWIGREATVRGSILGRNCHIGRNAVLETPVVLGDKTVITDYSKL